MAKIPKFLKNKILLATLGAIFLLAAFAAVISVGSAQKNNKSVYDYYKVARGTILEQVSATGSIKPDASIDYSFETNGKIESIPVKAGDKVTVGTVLASLDDHDILNQVALAQAGVDAAEGVISQSEAQLMAQQAKLREIQAGDRPEDLELTQTQINSAKKAVASAQTNLDNVNTKAQNDLAQLLNDCANGDIVAVNAGLGTLNTITDIQYNHFNSNTQDGIKLFDAKTEAVKALVGLENAGSYSMDPINKATGGARGEAIFAKKNQSEDNITKALDNISAALEKISVTIDIIPFNNTILNSAEKANLSLERSNMTNQISLVSGKIKAIGTQKILNNNLISAAASQLDQAQSAFDLATKQLILKKAGALDTQVEAQAAAVEQVRAGIVTQEAQLRVAEANLASADSMLSKTELMSTVEGIVARVSSDAGEMTTATKPVVTVITQSKYKIEANLAEADIGKIDLNNTAEITLDAYGEAQKFAGKVTKIDPAETLINGIINYTVTLSFDKDDPEIKSGLTANIVIDAEKKENVLVAPLTALLKKNDQAYVLADKGGPNPAETQVIAGLYGSDGNVEIIAGLDEGDKIVNFGK